MTDHCEHEHECYRGPIHQDDTFSIVATGVSPTNKNFLYVLCNSGYYDSDGNFKERFFFSRDPYDYIHNYNKDSLNNGYSIFRYEKTDKKLHLKFNTKLLTDFFHNPNLNIQSKIFSLNNLDTSDISQNTVLGDIVNFDINPERIIKDGLLHVGTEYNITSPGGDLVWYLKKDEDQTISLRNFMNSNVYDNTNFGYSKAGISIFSIGTTVDNNDGLSIFTVTSVGLCNDLNIIKDSGRFIIKNVAEECFYYGYSTRPQQVTGGGGGVSINYNKIYGSEFTGNGLSIYFFDETAEDNYEKVSNNEDLKFYFIPTEHFSYFSDSRSLQNIIYNHSFQTHVSGYNYQFIDSFDNKDNLKNKSIPFLVNKIINRNTQSLPDFFTGSNDLFLGDTFLSNTYTFNDHNNIIDIPYLIWTKKTDSIHGYFYPYCKEKETCGYCYGLTNNLNITCHTHNNTYKSGLGALDQSQTQPPLSSTKNQKKIDVIIIIIVVVIIIILSGIMIYKFV